MKNSVKKIVKYAVIALLSVVVLLLVWGVLIEPRFFDVEEETVEIPALPAEWEGRQIAVIADLQVGMWFNNTDTLADVVDTIVERRPAAVLIAGDFLYHPTDDDGEEEVREETQEDQADIRYEIEKVNGLLRPLIDAQIPVYAVLGNHDYAMETPEAVKLEWVARELAAALEQNGIEVLENRAAPIRQTGQNGAPAAAGQNSLYIVGIGSHYAGRAQPAAAVSQVPAGAPRLVFMHSPDSFAELPAGSAPLAVAGHTHGGQVRLPFMPNWSWLEYKVKGEAHADGWIRDFGQPGNRLYVNRGIGFSKLPVRINCFPELTMITLRRQSE